MRILGIDTNSFYLALTVIDSGDWEQSHLLPHDGPARREDHPKKPTNKNKLFENRSARERLDVMADLLDDYVAGTPLDYAYIEEPPFVNSVKTFAELTAVVMVCREILRRRRIPVSLVNVSTWKKEAIGNAKADKTEIKNWAVAHAGMPEGLTEDEYDAGVIAFRGAVAAGDVK